MFTCKFIFVFTCARDTYYHSFLSKTLHWCVHVMNRNVKKWFRFDIILTFLTAYHAYFFLERNARELHHITRKVAIGEFNESRGSRWLLPSEVECALLKQKWTENFENLTFYYINNTRLWPKTSDSFGVGLRFWSNIYRTRRKMARERRYRDLYCRRRL